MTVRELTQEEAEKLGLEKAEGVIVTAIADGTPAAESEIRPGDLILEINREPIGDMADFNKATDGIKKGDMVLFLIKRGPYTHFFTLEVK
jgi:serine protease Do